MVPRDYVGRPAVIIGTGPSLDPIDVELCRDVGLVMFGVNRTWEFGPHEHVTVNPEWWDYEAQPDLFQMMAAGDIRCWCSDQWASTRWGLNHFGWRDDAEVRGLSDDPDLISLGHSSGFAALNIAYLMGCEPILLLGHDMSYPKDYDGRSRKTGGKRHYFGEYHKAIQHWPSAKVGPSGELYGLIGCYNRVAHQDAVQIINCTPGSAMSCFPIRRLEEALDAIYVEP